MNKYPVKEATVMDKLGLVSKTQGASFLKHGIFQIFIYKGNHFDFNRFMTQKRRLKFTREITL